MSICAFVPLRAGGSRVGPINGLDKERALLGGKPLMAWTIEAAVNSRVFDAVYAVVASEAHAAMAQKYGAQTIRRPDYTVRDGSPDIEWVEFVLKRFRGEYQRYDAFSILRVTSPFRTAEHIKEAWKLFYGTLGVDSLRSVRQVSEHPGKMWVIRNERLFPLLPMGPADQPWHSSATQDLFKCYVQTAGMEFAFSDMVLYTHTIAGSTVVPYIVEGPAALDINTMEDWLSAERLVQPGR